MPEFRPARPAPDPQLGSRGSMTASDATAAPGRLKDVFADLISYVLLFQAICGERPPAMADVRDKIDALIAEQERSVKAGEVSWDAYREALFAVLSWVDDVILNSAWPYRNQWRHLMLATFGTLNAGKEFFQRLEALPAAARDVKEVYFQCLGLGFAGRYALGDNPEQQQLREYRHRLYRDITGSAALQRERLFPEAYERPRRAPRAAAKRIGIAWFALALLIPAVVFGVYWYLLHRQTAELLARIATPIAGPRPVALSLVEELRARGIQADQAARGVVITLPNLLFEVGSAELSAEGQRKIVDIANALKRYAAGVPIVVEGHASRERGTPEEQNQRLSEDRATNVVSLLRQSGLQNERVTAKGFGSKSPIASNDTEDGRRKNRRVEIIAENVK